MGPSKRWSFKAPMARLLAKGRFLQPEIWLYRC